MAAAVAAAANQVNKLIYVKDVEDITATPYVARELMLVKVGCCSFIRFLGLQARLTQAQLREGTT